ncbi:HpcH/HpaI aldolase/citrate lyase family protein [Actinomadura rayongensis]|uniref:HpcH/HpaI aldolase/citrate lyase family protein n=1 Tax=Actinomadura rayongensis TaxID=1429076 RepID=A0A6I4W6F0_9ACTN|nr:HpcH/HpaI aldolase/citrate lyase family protein [Actinomadura rayongensis]MXQ63776.1 HpcH/HpaI aldolase/citrate lyase family protein [Actinomadura rayongensis]
MRHFDHIDAALRKHLFFRHPRRFDRHDDPAVLAVALGATLYSPAIRPNLADDIRKAARAGVTSLVVCLEDSIADADLPAAEENAVRQLRALHAGGAEAPLLFLRVRNPCQIGDLTVRLGAAAELITGFVLPKFTAATGGAYLDVLAETGERSGRRLLAMPVIESRDAVHVETRRAMLGDVAELLAKHRDLVLAVRIGATDLSSAYGLRRPPDLSIYDIAPVAGAISDIVNVLGRADGTGFVVTGPVWEYFSAGERMFKPQLRESPFLAQRAAPLRRSLIVSDVDGLIREVHLDKANGLTGKTVIHPSHVSPVHALSVVTHEEYCDAADILGVAGGGAMASAYANKMNEAKPHRAWAERLMLRARVFGVAAEGVTFVELLDAAGSR